MRLSRPEFKKKLSILLGAALLLAGALAILHFGTNKPTADTVVAEVITYSTDAPDETEPGPDFTWKGAANDPKKIIIPSLGIDNYIQNVGVDQNSEIAVPNNVHMAGWFVDSVRPGDKGLSIIDGHLDGRARDGIFANLTQLEQGAQFTIEFGDGSTRTFVVKSVQSVDLNEAADVLYSQDPSISNQLNLITCGGNFDRDSRLYDKRVIVVATRSDL